MRASGSIRCDAQAARGLFAEGQATPENLAAASPTTYRRELRADDLRAAPRGDVDRLERRFLHQTARGWRDHADRDPGYHAFDNARSMPSRPWRNRSTCSSTACS
jgi:hypothetical protein